MFFTLILALVFAVVAVVFALENTEIVTVSFLNLQITESLALIFLGTVALGILIGVLLMIPSAVKRSLALSGEKRKLKGAEKELDKHKTQVTEFEEKAKKEEERIQQIERLKEEKHAKEEVVADVKQRLDDAAK